MTSKEVDNVRNSLLAIKATQKQSCEDEDIAKAFQLGLGFGFCEKNDNRWIPVSEKLPNLNDYTGPKVWQKEVLITGYLSFDDEKNLFVTTAFASDVINKRVFDTIIVAWMPLPKPYNAEREVNK